MYDSLPLVIHGVWRRLSANLGARTGIQTLGARNIKSLYISRPLRFKANCCATFPFTSFSNWRKRLHRLSLCFAMTFVHMKWMHLKLNMIARSRGNRRKAASRLPALYFERQTDVSFPLTDWCIDSFSCRCAKDDLALWQAFTSDPLATRFVTPEDRRDKRKILADSCPSCRM